MKSYVEGPKVLCVSYSPHFCTSVQWIICQHCDSKKWITGEWIEKKGGGWEGVPFLTDPDLGAQCVACCIASQHHYTSFVFWGKRQLREDASASARGCVGAGSLPSWLILNSSDQVFAVRKPLAALNNLSYCKRIIFLDKQRLPCAPLQAIARSLLC